MLSLMWYLRDRLSYLRDERGAETLEYILIGSLILAAGVIIYGALGTGLETAVTDIANFISGQVP